MGNAAFKNVGQRPEASNIAAMKTLLQKYESLKTKTQDGMQMLLSDQELYRELEQELVAELAGDAQDGPRRASDADAREQKEVSDVVARARGSNREAAGMGMGVKSKKRSTSNVSILVVDDSHISCKLATRALGQHDIHCEVALNGQLGLDMLLIRPTDFDLVLLDIVMPGLDGIEVLNRLKGHPQLKDMPVAMLSGLEDRTLADVCLQQGAVAVLPKPMKMDGVLSVVRQHCRRARPPAPISTVPGQPSSRSSQDPQATTGGSAEWDLRNSRTRPRSSKSMRTGPWRRRYQTGSPVRWGGVAPGKVVPNVDLLDAKFHSYRLLESLSRKSSRKLLVAFFPAAIAEAGSGRANGLLGSNPTEGSGGDGGRAGGSDAAAEALRPNSTGLLSALNENVEEIRATRTDVVGVGSDLPFTMSTLSLELGLQYPLLSDPFLHAGEEFVGTFDLSVPVPERPDENSAGNRSSGRQSRSEAESGDGVVVVDNAGVCRYRWIADHERDSESLDMSELLKALREPCQEEQPERSSQSLPSAADEDEDDEILDTPAVLEEPLPAEVGDNPLEAITRNGTRIHLHDSVGWDAASESNGSGQQGAKMDRLGLRKGDPILVVDDSTISSKLAMRKLRALGHPTMHAENGQTALALLRKDPSKIRLVLLDIVMPIMDGVELLTVIKGDAALQGIPVVMLSGLEDEMLGTACVESGAAAVLQKPLKTKELQSFLQCQKEPINGSPRRSRRSSPTRSSPVHSPVPSDSEFLPI